MIPAKRHALNIIPIHLHHEFVARAGTEPTTGSRRSQESRHVPYPPTSDPQLHRRPRSSRKTRSRHPGAQVFLRERLVGHYGIYGVPPQAHPAAHRKRGGDRHVLAPLGAPRPRRPGPHAHGHAGASTLPSSCAARLLAFPVLCTDDGPRHPCSEAPSSPRHFSSSPRPLVPPPTSLASPSPAPPLPSPAIVSYSPPPLPPPSPRASGPPSAPRSLRSQTSPTDHLPVCLSVYICSLSVSR